MSNSSWSWRNSIFSKISKNRWWGATTKNWKILANRKENHWSLRIRQFKEKNFFWKKIFKIEIANVIYRTIFNKSEIFFWSIAQIERGFQKLGHLVITIVCLKIFEFLKVTVEIYVKSRLLTAQFKKFQICSDSKTVWRFGICITLRAKMSPTPSLKSSVLPRYNELGQISLWQKFDNF